MKNKNTIIAAALALIAGLLIGFANPFAREKTVKPSAQIKQYQKEIAAKDKEIDSLNDKYDELASQKDKAEKVGVDDTNAKSFFKTIFEYNNQTWTSRFKTAEKYGSTEAIKFFNPEGFQTDKPNSDFKSVVYDSELFVDPINTKKGVMWVKYGAVTGDGESKTSGFFNITLDNNGKIQTLTQATYEDDDNTINGYE